MGTGDQININVFGQPDLTTQVTLDAVGMITLPLIGPVKALGLLPRQLERLVSTRLVEGGYLKAADVVVNVQQTRSRFFSVLGEVVRPGRYPLENTLSLLDALAEAGGATDKAEPVVTLIRGPQDSGSADSPTEAVPAQRFSIDPRKGPDPTLATLALRNRDVLFVPAKQNFYVYGEVRNPGVFSIEPGLSLLKALSMAGGLTDRGSERRVVLTRKAESGINRESSAELTETIQPGDVIRVKERLF
jgi:polysaccharide export outer membrane protein